MTSGRLRRRASDTDLARDEGPFVSFTDLFIGILFLFLILVAVLMLMHQQAVEKDKAQTQQIAQQLQQIQTKIDTTAKLDVDHPPYRLAIVYNIYEAPKGDLFWSYSSTIQIFRAPNGLCLVNIMLRNNQSLAWKPTVEPDKIPTTHDKTFIEQSTPCRLSASGDHWNSASETGNLTRQSENLYDGTDILHKKSGDETLDMQYRVLGIYDDYFRIRRGGQR